MRAKVMPQLMTPAIAHLYLLNVEEIKSKLNKYIDKM